MNTNTTSLLQRFFINGAPVRINQDTRFPRYLLNSDANVINVVGGIPTATPTAGSITYDVSKLSTVLGSVVSVRRCSFVDEG